jgi:hypothetical protein
LPVSFHRLLLREGYRKVNGKRWLIVGMGLSAHYRSSLPGGAAERKMKAARACWAALVCSWFNQGGNERHGTQWMFFCQLKGRRHGPYRTAIFFEEKGVNASEEN